MNKQKIIKILLVAIIVFSLVLQEVFGPINKDHESFVKKIFNIVTN